MLLFFNLSLSKATWITCPCRKNKDMERNHKFGGLVIHILPRQHGSRWRSREGCDLACKPGFEEECWHVGAIPYALLAAVNKRWLVHLISQQLSGILAKLYSKMFKGWLQGKGRQYSFCLPGGHVCSSDVTWKLWKDPIKALNIQLKFPDHKQLIFLSSTLFLVSNWFYKTSNMYCY